MTLLEICVDEPGGVDAAIAGGADRLELCAALALGGLTPSPAFVDYARRAARGRIGIHAIVRPRAGDFAYDDAEEAIATAEALALIAAGVDGLVFGATRDRALDEPLLARWVATVRERAPHIALTLHRAVDATADPVAAVPRAAALGFDRILTSGGATTAPAGAATIARMVDAASVGGPTILAGAGVRAENVAALVAATGVREVHASAGMPARSADAGAAALGFDAPRRRVTDPRAVRALRDALDRLSTEETDR